MKLFCDCSETEQQLAVSECPLQMPLVLVLKGLDAKQKKYLFDKMRQFLPGGDKGYSPVQRLPLLTLTPVRIEADTGTGNNDEMKATEEHFNDQSGSIATVKKSNKDRRQLLCDSDYEPVVVKRGNCLRVQKGYT